MPTRAVVARSTVGDGYKAGHDVAERIQRDLAAPADLILVFATAGYDQEALVAGIRAAAPDVPVCGCSGEGVIAPGWSDEGTWAVAAMAIASSNVSFSTFLVDGYSEDAAAAGRRLAERVRASGADQARGLIVLPDGLTGDCTAFLEALSSALPLDVPIVGGGAADTMAFERTFQYASGTVASGAVAAVLIRGRATLDVSVSHGCEPIGRKREVTRASGPWIHEIDGRPAWEVFKEYLDGEPRDLNAEGIAHLCIGEPLPGESGRAYDPYVVRAPMRLDAETGSLYFPGGLQVGSWIQLTRRDPDKIRQSAAACAERIRARHQRPPALVLQFDCAGRGRLLFGGRAAAETIHPLQETFAPGTPWLGFHTFGEIAPLGGRPFHHNYTVALCALYDEDGA